MKVIVAIWIITVRADCNLTAFGRGVLLVSNRRRMHQHCVPIGALFYDLPRRDWLMGIPQTIINLRLSNQ